MGEEPARPKLTADQVILLYERRLQRATLWHLVGGFACAGVGFLCLFLFEFTWPGWVLLGVSVVAGGMLQRLLVLRVRCPACGARVLARIHSIVQARSIKSCPHCDVTLRR